MRWQKLFGRLAPDMAATLARFPFAILLLAALTAVTLGWINELVKLDSELWARLSAGLATGAMVAAAGVLYREARPERHALGMALAWMVPVLAMLAFLPDWTNLYVPYALPVVAVLWLSLAASTRVGQGSERQAMQMRFWWLNNVAVATAAFALLAFLVLALGTVAIERSLGVLFGLDVEAVFYKWVLPVIGVFFVPVYWLAVQPHPDGVGFDAQTPELLQRASGFLGPFVLVPMLLAYALILLAYCLQIIVTGTLPKGMLGWMVMGFTITGAATWLILYPSGFDRQPVVRFFLRFWWWLTIVPLGLFALAVWQRIAAYGLTPERVGLIWGGLCAASLTGFHLLGKGDIRLIPALAGLFLLIASIGPWNVEAWPRADQTRRLETAIAISPMTPEAAERARGALDYLAYEGDEGRAVLLRIAEARGVAYDRLAGPYALRQALGIPEAALPDELRQYRSRDRAIEVNVADTPFFIGAFSAYGSTGNASAGLAFVVKAAELVVSDGTPVPRQSVAIDLAAWLDRQEGETLTDPVLDFVLAGRAYRLIIDDLSFEVGASGEVSVYGLSGVIFAGEGPKTSATPRDPAAPGS
ncbi:protein of unknown function [Devosia enhydra]|uniref:DUF4153 domain-containing protein n=1 Tax=Devosia enhydra TaxID=665118 RepID=A0A1K2HUV2_9HYPH|nr:DUF4153 domain-containing protein [Devosia enhydra]SFZ82348.1 protein of unknown function [Devosia enhydra]